MYRRVKIIIKAIAWVSLICYSFRKHEKPRYVDPDREFWETMRKKMILERELRGW